MRIVKVWLTAMCLCCLSLIYGQSSLDQFEVSSELNRLISPINSPEAASFAKYGNTPVSLYTGTPQINVPLYVFKGRELNLPFQLSYDASGIKVNQEASQVGLGWNLNMGGRISRQVNGLPDDYIDDGTGTNYYTLWNDPVRDQILYFGENVTTSEGTVFENEAKAIEYLEFIRDINSNRYDTQPDYFTFSAMGYSETFVVDMTDYSIHPLNNPRMKAEIQTSPARSGLSAPPSIDKWIITTDDGTVFEFDKWEVTLTQDANDTDRDLYALNQKYVSSWYLTKVISPLNKDTYQFNYLATSHQWERLGASSLVSRVRNVIGPPTGVSGLTEVVGLNDSRTWVIQYNLESITHNGRQIASFNYGSRVDTGTPTALTDMTFYKDDGSTALRSIDLVQAYFKNGSATAETIANKAKLRLRLNKVRIKDQTGSIENTYEFSYFNPNAMPTINSKAQDYYGYYNGKNSNAVLYPEYGLDPAITDGADRSINLNTTLNGTLSKITYPTGGFTEFEYESNVATDHDPTQVTSSTTFQSEASLSVDGGAICQGCWYDHPGDYCGTPGCIDTYLEIGGPPVVASQVFNLDTNKTLMLQLALSGTVLNNYGKHVIIFKRSDVTDCASSPTPAPLPFNEVVYPAGGLMIPSEDVVYHNTTAGPDFNIQDLALIMEAGCYQIMVVNPEEGSTYTLYLGQYVTSTSSSEGTSQTVARAGIRVKRIKDYSADGQLATQKEYSYGTGTVISQPLYSFLRDDWIVYTPGGGVINIEQQHQVLYRQSQVNGLDRPHIGYEKVTEKMIDFNDPSNNTSTPYWFNTDHWGSYFAGGFQYYIQGKQTATNYSVKHRLGKLHKKSSYGDVITLSGSSDYVLKYSEETNYDSRNFFTTQGIYLLQREEKRNQFFRIMDNPTAEYPNGKRLDYVDGVLQPYFGGTPVFAHPDSCSGVLCEGELGALSFQITRAFGNAGQISSQRNFQQGTLLGPVVGDNYPGMEIITVYDYYDDPSETVSNYLTKTVATTKSNGEILTKQIKYPEHYPTQYAGLISANMLAIPVETTTTGIDDSADPAIETVLSTRKTEFTGKLPNSVQYGKGDATTLENRILVTEYRNNNITEVLQPDGTQVSYVWGYDKRYIVAKVVGVAYDTIESTLDLSEFSPLSGALTTARENTLRALAGSMVSTYQYEPLVGVTKMTDERGYSMYYEYDDFQRLVRVKDDDGNILQENNYSLRENN